MSNILTQAQAAAICNIMRALGAIDGNLDRACVGGTSEGFLYVSCTNGSVSVWIRDGRTGHGRELRSEDHQSQFHFAEAYGQPTEGLMPF